MCICETRKLWILKTNWNHALRTSSHWASTDWETDVAYLQLIKIFVLGFYSKCNLTLDLSKDQIITPKYVFWLHALFLFIYFNFFLYAIFMQCFCQWAFCIILPELTIYFFWSFKLNFNDLASRIIILICVQVKCWSQLLTCWVWYFIFLFIFFNSMTEFISALYFWH